MDCGYPFKQIEILKAADKQSLNQKSMGREEMALSDDMIGRGLLYKVFHSDTKQTVYGITSKGEKMLADQLNGV